MPGPTKDVGVARWEGGGGSSAADVVVVEEPLEIRVAGDTIATTMRTPGHDRELTLGFLFAEGVLASRDDVSAIAHCGRTGDEGRGNTIEVTPAPGARLDLDPTVREARRGTITAACGVCGRRTIDDLLARAGRVPDGPAIPLGAVALAMSRLRDAQPVFARTGGCHGAALAGFDGEIHAVYEDVGRHNAVDKLVGAELLAGRVPLADRFLVVSGRVSFEIVQKAAMAKIPAIAAVSAASSLAIETAERVNVLLAGFVRGERAVVYANAHRAC